MSKLIGNIIVTDICIDTPQFLNKVLKEHRSIYYETTNSIYPAAVVANWSFNKLLGAMYNNKLFYCENLSKAEIVIPGTWKKRRERAIKKGLAIHAKLYKEIVKDENGITNVEFENE